MLGWPTKPFIYEINTSVWLNNLSKRYGHPITFANVPDEVINELAAYNVDAIWLMGVWQRSTAAQKSALNYIHEYKNALPDIEEEDVLGSAYAIGDYQTAKGTLLEGRGVIPDEVVPVRRTDLLAGKDAQLESALRWLSAQSNK